MVTEAREKGSLIGSDKVEGTAVYGANDTKIGSIERVMIDKQSGKATNKIAHKIAAVRETCSTAVSTISQIIQEIKNLNIFAAEISTGSVQQ